MSTIYINTCESCNKFFCSDRKLNLCQGAAYKSNINCERGLIDVVKNKEQS